MYYTVPSLLFLLHTIDLWWLLNQTVHEEIQSEQNIEGTKGGQSVGAEHLVVIQDFPLFTAHTFSISSGFWLSDSSNQWLGRNLQLAGMRGFAIHR